MGDRIEGLIMQHCYHELSARPIPELALALFLIFQGKIANVQLSSIAALLLLLHI